MKPRTLARYALKWIEDGSFIFDNEFRKTEAIKQLKRIINGKTNQTNNPDDPIIELHIGLNVPNFDYPIVPLNNLGEPFIFKEDNRYIIPSKTHVLKGIGLSGEKYYMDHLINFVPYKNAIIKVDKFTDMKRAACVFVNNLCQVLNKKDLDEPNVIQLEYEVLKDIFKNKDKTFETSQKKLYIKWLGMFISIYNKNPETHMKVLKKDLKII